MRDDDLGLFTEVVWRAGDGLDLYDSVTPAGRNTAHAASVFGS
jgi:hypothetical protein